MSSHAPKNGNKYGWKELEMRNNFAPKIRNKMWLERA
jgi:hypothetical protein